MSDLDKGRAILSTFGSLVSEREPLNTLWADAYRLSYPARGQGFLSQSQDGISNAVAANAAKAVLFTTTATDSVRLLASSVLSALTPPSSQWFNLAIPNVETEDIPQDAKEWLEDAAEKLHTMIHGSNYDSQSLEFFTDIMVAGMAGLYIEKDRFGALHFEAWPLHSMWCVDTMRDERIDTIYRKIPLTITAALKRFGDKGITQEMKDEIERNPYSTKKYDYIHVIRPRLRNGKQLAGKLKTTQPWESVYVNCKTGEVAYESGYHEMPCIVPRWLKLPDTDYAVGPMDAALPDVKTLNKVVEMMLLNADMAIGGIIIAKNDGVFNPNTMRIGPRRVWNVADVGNIKNLDAAGDINFAIAEISRLQTQIRTTLLADQLGPSERANATATEINTRTSIIRQILGPIFSRLQSEFLQHLIARVFGLAFRDGDLGQPPESLAQYQFKIAYTSPLARAQKMSEVQAMDQFETHLLNAAVSAQKPELLDLYNLDGAIRKRAEYLGVDIELMVEEQQVKKNRKERAAQVQAAQDAQLAAQAQGAPA
jgi:hypothetical protein